MGKSLLIDMQKRVAHCYHDHMHVHVHDLTVGQPVKSSDMRSASRHLTVPQAKQALLASQQQYVSPGAGCGSIS